MNFSPPETKEDTNNKPPIGGVFPNSTHGFQEVGPTDSAGLSSFEDKRCDE